LGLPLAGKPRHALAAHGRKLRSTPEELVDSQPFSFKVRLRENDSRGIATAYFGPGVTDRTNKVKRQIQHTYSLPLLVQQRWSILNNFLLNLGSYIAACDTFAGAMTSRRKILLCGQSCTDAFACCG
jgi:hypothetical protein